MRYSILGFSQEKVLLLQENYSDDIKKKKYIDVTDLLILQCMSNLISSEKVFKYNINGNNYSCVHYKAILEDLPILRIKKQALSDRINKLCSFGLIKKEIIKNQTGTWTAFMVLDDYKFIRNNCPLQSSGKKKNNYIEKLKDPRWQKKRLEILNRDDFKCKKCGNTSDILHIHHLFYKRNAEPWEYDNDTLVTLCHECHSKIHSK